MSTNVDDTHVEIPNKLHAILKRISFKTGIKLKHLAMELIVAGLRSDKSARMVARSGVAKEVEEIEE